LLPVVGAWELLEFVVNAASAEDSLELVDRFTQRLVFAYGQEDVGQLMGITMSGEEIWIVGSARGTSAGAEDGTEVEGPRKATEREAAFGDVDSLG
jgi:hypothetical protein